MQNKYNLGIVANDLFTPLYNFWYVCKHDKTQLVNELRKRLSLIDKSEFMRIRSNINAVYTVNTENAENAVNNVLQAEMYFIINRCSFSGATLSGGFSLESSNKRFTSSSIDRIQNLDLSGLTLYNLDFKEFLDTGTLGNCLLFLDPPYYLGKDSKLYGNNGDLHESFDHVKLFECLSKRKSWVLTYNNCDYIKDLYKDYTLVPTSWSYGMNKSKESSEIVIINV
ncbi:putative D12 class N6 adenine-specific DNA methyltransferase [Mimivirus AB-566-O17]|uniref:Putative D12 class N6 adenine-specific DNA methyltransferase n=1 Tax=Mimivirus AB-566-O17 TaxID=1988039 RepID=A0A1X9VNQ5_9VIRU|nr:putative D12 class N6 adenine-specific DNA methyltransferase [Mimivirus AB-566-O17]